ncbi:conserved hypothetical protein [Culex quinquefasciatus]|uniref:Uncharacterized protein n=1 Tax=Culex quinquefasciatus TaxID=7176 RepID=B0X5V9_CULQU|nr:conserved hypothetical protein [Culex quinquefasciatus]|eukprot:XP_001865031.1 conserved hypothetical protein [Culex quinquefasciatus]
MELTSHCRICHRPEDASMPLRSIYSSDESEEIVKMMEELNGGQLIVDELRSSEICATCLQKVHIGYAIQRQIREAEATPATSSTELVLPSGTVVKVEDVFIEEEEENDGYEYEFLEDEYLEEDQAEPVQRVVRGRFFIMPKEEVVRGVVEHVEGYREVQVEGDRCCGCSFVGVNRKELLQHSDKAHVIDSVGSGNYCPICFGKFAREETLTRHIDECRSRSIFVCGRCNRYFNRRGKIERHLVGCRAENVVVPGEEAEESDTMEIEFATGSEWEEEEEFKQVEEKLRRKVAPKLRNVVDTFQYVKLHGERCCGCDFFCEKREELFRHAREVHEAVEGLESLLKCSICCVEFEDNPKLQQHINFNTSKELLICTICDEAFSGTGHLLYHQEMSLSHKDLCVAQKAQILELKDKSVREELVRLSSNDKDPTRHRNNNRSITRHRHLSLPEPCFITDIDDFLNYQIITVSGERCCGCGQFFQTFKELVEHGRREHLLEHPEATGGYQCDICFSRFIHCRICQHPEDPSVPLRSIYSSDESEEIVKMMKELNGGQLIVDELRSSEICATCLQKVRIGYAIQRQIREAEATPTTSSTELVLPSGTVVKVEDVFIEEEAEEEEDGYEYEFLEDEYLEEDQAEPVQRVVRGRFFIMPKEEVVRGVVEHVEGYREVQVEGDRCCGCSFVGLNRKELLQHSDKAHVIDSVGSGNYCPICFGKFAREETLTRHIDECRSRSIFVCGRCNRYFNRRGKIERHLVGCRAENVVVPGEEAEESDTMEIEFATGSEWEEEEEFKPVETNYEESRSKYECGDLQQHINFNTSKELLICTICDEAFSGTGHLLYHQETSLSHKDLCVAQKAQILELKDKSVREELVRLSSNDKDPTRHRNNNRSITRHRHLSLPEPCFITDIDDFLNYQIITVSGERCCGCGQFFQTFKELVEHGRREHLLEHPEATGGYQCDICFSRFMYDRGLILHQSTRRSLYKMYHCTICNLVFSKQYSITKHLQSAPNHNLEQTPKPTQNQFHCCFPKCAPTFPSEDLLLEHCITEHAGKRRENESERTNEANVCAGCLKSFENTTTLVWHRTMRFTKRYTCRFCPLEFTRWPAFRDHENQVHLGKSIHFPCETCGKLFRTAHSLKAHALIHSEARSEVCDECGAAFRNKGVLKRHKRAVHAAEFRFDCGDCGKKFPTREQMQAHSRVHTGVKPYPCRFCERAFKHFTDRKRHEMSTHTGERPYKCAHCSAAYIRNRELVIHLQKHNGEGKDGDGEVQ